MDAHNELYEKIKSYRKTIFTFDREVEDKNFKPFHRALYTPKENGYYLTIRCGLSGIYTELDEWKSGEGYDGGWQLGVLDGSRVIAFSRKKIEL